MCAGSLVKSVHLSDSPSPLPSGVGLAHGDVGGADAIMNTNYKGPLRMTEVGIDM